jgi:hypothetical protein
MFLLVITYTDLNGSLLVIPSSDSLSDQKATKVDQLGSLY